MISETMTYAAYFSILQVNLIAGTGDASQLPSSVMVGTRVATAVMNRTAIGLSSLSHRERELLS